MNVERYQNRTKLEFEIEFITPTFLGGANGDAEIRTAPFKNLIRRWWRIVNGTLSQEKLWKKECELFGSAADKNSIKSKVDLKIVSSEKIYFGEPYKESPKINFDTVSINDVSYNVAVYLGYGVIKKVKNKYNKVEIVSSKRYIMPGSKLTLALELPEQYKKEMIQVLYCIDLFGTIGAKSRNGFGSIAVKPVSFDFEECELNLPLSIEDVVKNGKHYPNSLVSDDDDPDADFLIWTTKEYRKYETVMNILCGTYIRAKKTLKIPLFGAADKDDLPDGADRLPSLLTLKVWRDCDNQYIGCLIFIPYAVKDKSKEELKKEIKKVCQHFDNEKALERLVL